MDEPANEVSKPPPGAPGGRAAIVAWVVLGLAFIVMVAGMGTAFTLASRSPRFPPNPTSSTEAPASVRPFAAPSIRPRREAVPAPSMSVPEAEANANGPTMSREDRRALLPLDPDMPVWGDQSALVTVVLFGDLECSHTRHLLGRLGAVKARFGPDLRIAFRHRPISSHARARETSQVAAAIHAEHGDRAFWTLAQELAKSATPASPERWRDWARGSGDDPARLAAWSNSPTASDRVTRDLDFAVRFAVRQSPTYFVNGTRIEGYRTEYELVAEIEHELALSIDALRNGTPKGTLYARRTAQNLAGIGSTSPERFCAPLAGAPARGPANALVTVVFFGDFACEYCRRMAPVLSELSLAHAADLRLVYQNLPHAEDELSLRIGLFAQAAWAQGGAEGFWRVYEELYRGDVEFDDARLGRVARAAGLASAPLVEASRQAGLTPELETLAEQAEELEIDGTPTVLINGRRFEGLVARSTLASALGQEVALAQQLMRHGIQRTRLYDAICPPEPVGAAPEPVGSTAEPGSMEAE